MKASKQINQKDLKKIRAFFHKKQNGICPILKMKFNVNEMVVDHSHSANSRNLGKPKEAGLIRGVIHRAANSVEGKITNSYIRTGLHKFDITLPEFLRNLADFIENPPMINLEYLHPSEKPKTKLLKKTIINKLAKRFIEKYPGRKIPEVLVYKQKTTKNGVTKNKEKKLTVGIERLCEEFNITPEYRK